MKKNPFLLFLSLFVSAQFVAPAVVAQWQTESVLKGRGHLRSLVFISDRIGFVIECDPSQSSWSSNSLLKTTDSGTTWDTSASSELCSPSVFFVDSDIGYIATIGSAIGAQGIRKTANGGTTWSMADTTVGSSSSFEATALYFLNSAVGFASTVGAIKRTTNGGKSWEPVLYTPASHIAAIAFTSPQVGYAVGYDTPQILQTTDAGVTWHSLTRQYALLSVAFPSATKGYAVGWNGTIVYTRDAGNTWHTPTSTDGNTQTLRCVSCLLENTCFAVGDSGTILLTTDGGTTWMRQSSATTQTLNSVACVHNNTCFAVGDNGTVLKTANAVPTDISVFPESATGAQVYPHPATGTITFRLATAVHGAVLSVFNPLGQEIVHRNNVYGSTLAIDAQGIPSGLYFFSIWQDSKSTVTGTLLVE